MSEQTFVLSKSMVTENRINFFNGRVFLQQQVQFQFTPDEVATLIWFLAAAKAQDSVRHTFTEGRLTLEYDHDADEFHQFAIARPAIFRRISMAAETAWKLLDALTDKAEHEGRD